MSKVLKLTPFFSPRLWGGQELTKFGFKLPSKEKYGEAWVISALPQGMSTVIDGKYAKMTLQEVYEKHNAEVFMDQGKVFPLLAKIITPNDYLSVQVHPDDAYAASHHQGLGKPECWYVISAPANAKLIYGHNAKSETQLKNMVEGKEWDQLFKKIPVKTGDFIYVPPGKVHALSPEVVVYELQRSSDITYRFYDFDRRDANNQLRPLHIQDCLATTVVPDEHLPVKKVRFGELISNQYFTLYIYDGAVRRFLDFDTSEIPWISITVLSGQNNVGEHKLGAGANVIIYDLPNRLQISGTGKLLISYYKKILKK